MLGPYTTDIGPEILQPEVDGEVILCLNYDGKIGLNNMNRFFQNANQSSPAVSWYEWSYKKGDRVLFNDSSRFPILYNNLKGELVDIQKVVIFKYLLFPLRNAKSKSNAQKSGMLFSEHP